MEDQRSQLTGTLQEKQLLLSRAYFDQKSMDELVELANRLFENPVMLVDTTYCCLSVSPAEKLGIPSWDSLMETGYMSEEVVQNMGRYFSQMTSQQRHHAYIFERLEVNGENFRKIVSSIQYEGQVFGGIAIAEYHRKFNDDDVLLAEYLCKIFGALLFKEAFQQKGFNKNFEQLFWGILSKTGMTTKVLEGRLEALGLLSVNEPYYLIDIDILPAQVGNVEYFRIKIKEKFPDFFTVFFEDSLLIIGNISSKAYPEFQKAFVEFFKQYKLFACISNPFYSLTNLRAQYELVRQGCCVGQKLHPGTHFFEFKHLNLYCLLQEAASHFSLKDYLHPAIHTLSVYDEENSTDYCRTLIIYFENNLNILATANQLIIHRNTLTYRLKKISQMLNISLDDKYLCLNLLLAYLYDELSK